MEVRLCLCSIGMVRHTYEKTTKAHLINHNIERYWISYTWAEAEPVGKGVMPPRDRDYFHRYKIRFDWVNNQGEPWWDCESQIPLNLGTSPKNTPATTDLQTPGCADTLEEGSSISLGAAARLTIPVAPLRSTREFSVGTELVRSSLVQ